jgi:hypothetical protein
MLENALETHVVRPQMPKFHQKLINFDLTGKKVPFLDFLRCWVLMAYLMAYGLPLYQPIKKMMVEKLKAYCAPALVNIPVIQDLKSSLQLKSPQKFEQTYNIIYYIHCFWTTVTNCCYWWQYTFWASLKVWNGLWETPVLFDSHGMEWSTNDKFDLGAQGLNVSINHKNKNKTT